MAARHYFPYIPMEEVGPACEDPLPHFAALEPIRYKRDMKASRLVEMMRGKTRVALEAPPCSRKSVDMPAALVRGGLRPIVVHAMPGRPLAKRMHEYVRTVHKDVNMHYVDDYSGWDTFPTDGLVHVSTGVLCAYMVAWRTHGMNPGVVLFLDEMHESDFCTGTLRSFQTAAPGVAVYIEATATRGNGAGGVYARPELPSPVQDYTFVRQNVHEWNMYEKGKPWSLLKTTGDILIFEDDPQCAKVICDKFTAHGVRACRLYARMPTDEFYRTMQDIERPPPDVGIAAIVVDYSFRSGFTFPTVSRIIDPGEVQLIDYSKHGPAKRKRNAYQNELHQARARGGRVEGKPCDYWCGVDRPEPVCVMFEGVEADLACILHRMLGRRPSGMLGSALFATGMVPGSFTRIMCGDTPLRAYRRDIGWPGSSKVPASPATPSPLQANFPDSPASDEFVEVSAGRPPSVFTVDDIASAEGDELTEEQFNQAHERRSRVGAKPVAERPPPMPRLDKGGGVFDQAFAQVASAPSPVEKIEWGKYYHCSRLAKVSCSIYRNFEEVMQGIGDLSIAAFMRHASSRARADACYHALRIYNEGVAVATAACHVMDKVSKSTEVADQCDVRALRSWAEGVRDEYTRANARAQDAKTILEAAVEYHFVKMEPWHEHEASLADRFLEGLQMAMPDQQQHIEYRESIQPGFDPSGRYRLQIEPQGFRSKIALAIMGRKAGVIDLAVGPDEPGGSMPVYTTASQLAAASVKSAGSVKSFRS